MAMISGHIDSEKIKAVHTKMREIVTSFSEINSEVAEITAMVKENWVGDARDEFEVQYKLLKSEIDDFGDALKDIYDALVETEAAYLETDDSIRQEIVMSTSTEG